MVDLREIRRVESRKRRVLEKLGADQRELVKHVRIGKALEQLRQVLADETFRRLMLVNGIQSIPELLLQTHHLAESTLDRSLDFVIAWRFFSPFLYNPITAAYLSTRWPDLSLELKDTFISIVADGPFPYELRGRDRRTV